MMTSSAEIDPGNRDQAQFWSTAPGLKWVTHQVQLDRLMVDVLDLVVAAGYAQEGETVHDIGCGTGALALAIADRVGPGGRVDGFDISAPLLDLARRRAAGYRWIGFHEGDVQAGCLPDAAADLIVSRFGVMFFADPVVAFANMRRSLRPDGRLAFASWSASARNPWFTLPRAIAVERLGEPPVEPAGAPGPFAFADIPYVRTILQRAGFTAIDGSERAVTLRIDGGAAEAAGLAVHVGPVPRILRDMGGTDMDRDAIAAELQDEFEPFRTANGIEVPAHINLFTASRG
jgi:SAM-dependent methyltransferase